MNTKLLNARELKEQCSIVELLSRLGYEPVPRRGREKMYISMLCDGDTNPSFAVNEELGVWFDHGTGKGGNIIDFGRLYWRNLTFPEVLAKIVAVTNAEHRLDISAPLRRQKQQQPKEPNYQILKIQEVGLNQAITEYLQNRGVLEPAKGRLKEVYYYVEDEQKKRHNFFAAGWQNQNGSWEIRSTFDFKGCLGNKAISFIPRNEQSLAVFEGFFDYLSWLTENPFADESVLVLNSLSLLQAGIEKAGGFSVVSTYFDNDPSGRKASDQFTAALPQAIDRSGIYEGYNDYNDKIVAELKDAGLHR